MRSERGVTMLELLVTLTIAGILLAIGAPSLVDFLSTNRVASASNQLMGSLGFARSEAIKRGRTVTLCKSADGTSCTTLGGWEQGWIVFPDGSTQGIIDGTDAPLKVVQAFSGLTISGGGNFPNWFSYLANGSGDGATLNNGTFSLCNSPNGRNIIINDTGRVRSSAVAC
jgi:type IV fimbrial biogenesis protein FimT